MSKQAILLDSVDVSKIVVSSKWKINDICSKFFIGYLDEDFIRPLCVILPQMSGYIKCFEDSAKNMSFVTEDKDVYLKYGKIWAVVKKLLGLKFTVNPIRDGKYVLAKLKIFNSVNRTTFTDALVPMEKNHYVCISTIDINSVLKIDQKVYPQAYLEQCKYKVKKRKPANFIDFELSTDSDDDDDNKFRARQFLINLNFLTYE